MANFSTYLALELLDNTLRPTSAYVYPVGGIFMALFTSNTDLEGNTQTAEVSGFAYARTACAFDVATSTGITQNTGDIVFPVASGGTWGTVVAAAVCDASTAGQILYYADLAANKTIADGDTFKFLAGQFIVEHQ